MKFAADHRMPNITLRQLWHFVAAAESGKLSEAGKRLHLAPSALSSSIEELEKTLGVQLCIRKKAKGLTLTPSGEQALKSARNLLTEIMEFEYTFASTDSNSLSGPLTVGAYSPLAPLMLPAVESAFAKSYPYVQLDFIEDHQINLVDRLLEGQLDLAFLYDINLKFQLQRIPLVSKSPRVLLHVEHPLAQGDVDTPLHIDEIASEDFILFGASPLYEYVLSFFKEANIPPNVLYTSRSYGTVRAFVGRGSGIGIAFEDYELSFSVENRKIVSRPLTGPSVKPATICIALPPAIRASTAATKWVETTQELFNEAAHEHSHAQSVTRR